MFSNFLSPTKVADPLNLSFGSKNSRETHAIGLKPVNAQNSFEGRITFNVGGTRFETKLSSVRFRGSSIIKLQDPEFMFNHWDVERQEYFFDRDPFAFAVVLHYLRTGKLHLPQEICTPQITDELVYWGLPTTTIEPCCWKDFSLSVTSINNLRKLEKDRKPIYLKQEKDDMDNLTDDVTDNRCCSISKSLWSIANDPGSSHLAEVYAMVYLVAVSVSLLTFIVESSYKDGCAQPGKYESTYEMISNLPGACKFLQFVDMICFSFFLIDLVLHLVYCRKAWVYVKTPIFYIDVLALLSDIITFIQLTTKLIDSKTVLVDIVLKLSLLRVTRLFRFMHRLTGVMVILYALWKSIKELKSLLTILCITATIFGSAIAYVEEGSPSAIDNFLDGIWYSATTLTATGYGDVVPATILGKIIGAMCAVWGVFILGITIPTIINNFTQYHVMMHYIEERETIFKFRRYPSYRHIRNIPFPDLI